MVERSQGVDVEDLKRQLLDMCSGNKDSLLAQRASSRGETFTLSMDKMSIEVTLGKQWIGYVFKVDQSVLGRAIEIAEDTDNYELGGKNSDISIAIFENARAYVRGVLEESILVGKQARKLYVAVLGMDSTYRVFIKGRLFSTFKSMPKSSIQRMSFLKLMGDINYV